jgi:hypothetical protein
MNDDMQDYPTMDDLARQVGEIVENLEAVRRNIRLLTEQCAAAPVGEPCRCHEQIGLYARVAGTLG